MMPQDHRILIVGGGGREHALAWKLSASPRVAHIHVAPGNGGTRLLEHVTNVDIASEDIQALRDFALEQAITLTVVGPEAVLARGLVDVFEQAGLVCLGPRQAAAQLGASKSFARDFLARHDIPTAEHAHFDDYEQAAAYIRQRGAPIVVKADGPTAGRGVIRAATVDEALQAARDILQDRVFGQAGARLVVETYLAGEEASFIALVDGQHIVSLASSQDHRAAFDGGTGPSTDGMGTYSPAPVITDARARQIMTGIMQPIVAGLVAEGRPFSGFLYVRLMIDDDGQARVVGINVCPGDPETQVLMMRLDSDLLDLLEATVMQTLDRAVVRWRRQAALGVVMTSGGYPEDHVTGEVITGLHRAEVEGVMVFHGATCWDEAERLLTCGGRVLCVCALGERIAEAKQLAYQGVAVLEWSHVAYRHDIGYLALDRPQDVDA